MVSSNTGPNPWPPPFCPSEGLRQGVEPSPVTFLEPGPELGFYFQNCVLIKGPVSRDFLP